MVTSAYLPVGRSTVTIKTRKAQDRVNLTIHQLSKLYPFPVVRNNGLGNFEVRFTLVSGWQSVVREWGLAVEMRDLPTCVELEINCNPGCLTFHMWRNLAREIGVKIVQQTKV